MCGVIDTVRRLGGPDALLSDSVASRFIADALRDEDLAGKSVLLLIPDGTRTAPVPLVVAAVRGTLAELGARLTILVALGTHQPLDPSQLERLIGVPLEDLEADGVRVLNHAWSDPATFVSLGVISADEVATISGGRLAQDVDVGSTAPSSSTTSS